VSHKQVMIKATPKAETKTARTMRTSHKTLQCSMSEPRETWGGRTEFAAAESYKRMLGNGHVI
jgi:hypothetical protein